MNRRRLIPAVVAVAVIWGICTTWLPTSGDEVSGVRSPALVGARLAVPVTFRVPPGATATADGSYVALTPDDSTGAILVVSPTEVVTLSGLRAPLPADVVAWLQGHPRVVVTRVRLVRVGEQLLRQADYRLSRATPTGAGPAALQLFCGWQQDPHPADAIRTPCTRITADSRVRATFVPIGRRTLLVEAVWQGDTFYGRMPRQMRNAYYGVLAGLTPA